MSVFWLATVAIILFATFIILFPLLKRTNVGTSQRDELNQALYTHRLTELQQEDDAGLVEDKQAMIVDLQHSLLDDIPESETDKRTFLMSSKLVLIGAVIVMIALSYSLYVRYGAAEKVAHWQAVSERLPELSRLLMSENHKPMTESQLQDLSLALRTRLFYQPNDAMGWLLLGKVAIANQDANSAQGAMEKAYALKPENPTIALGYAQALMMSQDEPDQQQARVILEELVKRDYANLQVLSLIAFDAYRNQNYAKAITYWQAMQKLLPEQDSRHALLTRSIQSARESAAKEISIKGIAAKANSAEGKAVNESAQGGTRYSQSVAKASVPVEITLGANVAIEPGSVLVVSVHSADGSPMPIAAARYPIEHFPLKVRLDDSNSMIQGRKISDFSTFMVKARIDKDGNVSTKQGDWYGQSDVVKSGQLAEIEIDKRY
ncbi:c-type cytochrome biogenesis protein CcmI [Vibrio profundum]|uniref:c-type cytochrome biogenesis protein CcmI n=1 Tax=Vibrio profundum TaxID=2910247 RepID=UPI003D0FE9D2